MDESQLQLASFLLMLINLHKTLVSMHGLLKAYCAYLLIRRNKRRRVSEDDRQSIREISLRRIIFDSDLACIENTRMDQRSFHKLCDMLRTVGRLSSTKNMCVEEMVAIFLHICAHHVKNRVIRRQFVRSGETISRHFSAVLKSILLCYELLLKKPEPILENSTDYRWKWFKVL